MVETNKRLKGAIDMHIHSAPDVRQRKMTDRQIMDAAIKMGVRAVVIKSHLVPTADRASLLNMIKKEKYGDEADFTMYGGIALNRAVGGINPWAVEAALKLGAKVVWLPTNMADNHTRKEGRGAGVVCTENDHVVEPLNDVFKLIKDFDAVLATGHISSKECFIVTEAARNAGVKKISITHPEFHIVGMTMEERAKIVKDYDVMLECDYAQPVKPGCYKKNFPENVETIKTVGAEHVVMATDAGQMQNPAWNESFSEIVNGLYEEGIDEKDIDLLIRKNPAWLLGLNDKNTEGTK